MRLHPKLKIRRMKDEKKNPQICKGALLIRILSFLFFLRYFQCVILSDSIALDVQPKGHLGDSKLHLLIPICYL